MTEYFGNFHRVAKHFRGGRQNCLEMGVKIKLPKATTTILFWYTI